MPGHLAGQWQVRGHAIKVSPHGRTKARRRPKAVRLLRRVPQDVHRDQPWGLCEGGRQVAVRVHREFFISSLIVDQPIITFLGPLGSSYPGEADYLDVKHL